MVCCWCCCCCCCCCSGILVSIVVSIPACHAGDPGSIPGREVVALPLLSDWLVFFYCETVSFHSIFLTHDGFFLHIEASNDVCLHVTRIIDSHWKQLHPELRSAEMWSCCFFEKVSDYSANYRAFESYLGCELLCWVSKHERWSYPRVWLIIVLLAYDVLLFCSCRVHLNAVWLFEIDFSVVINTWARGALQV